jgi:hypothetical protein
VGHWESRNKGRVKASTKVTVTSILPTSILII